MDNPILFKFVQLTIFTLMFSIGINQSYEKLTSLWRQPGLLIRSLLSVLVLVPLCFILIFNIFDLQSHVMIALSMLAASPGAPLTSKRSEMAGGDQRYTASLQLTLALLATVTTPLILYLFFFGFALDARRIFWPEVASQVAEVTFMPVIIGLMLQKFLPNVTSRLAGPVSLLANILFIALFTTIAALIIFSPGIRDLLRMGFVPALAMVTVAAMSIVIGHFLGGPLPQQRSALAIANVARNVGLALFLAQLSSQGPEYIPTILSYMIIGAAVAVPYSIWSRRRIQAGASTMKAVHPNA